MECFRVGGIQDGSPGFLSALGVTCESHALVTALGTFLAALVFWSAGIARVGARREESSGSSGYAASPLSRAASGFSCLYDVAAIGSAIGVGDRSGSGISLDAGFWDDLLINDDISFVNDLHTYTRSSGAGFCATGDSDTICFLCGSEWMVTSAANYWFDGQTKNNIWMQTSSPSSYCVYDFNSGRDFLGEPGRLPV